jgi:GNAT superfamily N-acetyltransferase
MESKKSLEEERCPTVLIPDRVAAEDAFGHSKIAHAIADMILKGEEGGWAIALTGSWGSGKSTVVRLLEEELRDADENVRIFVFDAWAHQGDPLRRTFLETLIDWCQKEPNWTKEESDWSGVIEALAKRKEKSVVDSTPRLTRWGAAGAFSLLVAPIALELYEKTHYEWHPFWESIALLVSGLPRGGGTFPKESQTESYLY